MTKLCECGCGMPAPIATYTRLNRNQRKGQPVRFIRGHSYVLNPPRHGHAKRGTKSPEYTSYGAAKARCENRHNKHYHQYGGRGIEFRFSNFEQFLAEVGERPQPKHLYTLDRINTYGHYEPGNVRWATMKEQVANSRPNSGRFQRGMIPWNAKKRQ